LNGPLGWTANEDVVVFIRIMIIRIRMTIKVVGAIDGNAHD
jgi:hypothetical protein